MLSHAKRWFRARYAPILPPPLTFNFVPPVARSRPASSFPASEHYPPLEGRLSRGDPDAIGFRNEMRPGDEVWSFCSPPEDWRAKGGRKGVALVRNGLVVRSVVTMLN